MSEIWNSIATRRFIADLAAGDFLAGKGEVIIARAPGRLDLMGGIADYSGSLVLQYPIARATHVAFQWRDDRLISLRSLGGEAARSFALPLAALATADGGPIEYRAARALFATTPDHWAAYVVGAFLVLWRECGIEPNRGAAILINSDVPEGKGVSSSAALEVAAMTALVAAHGQELDPRRLALLCQKVENLVAGAPCGIMDQMTAACGQPGRLLALLCQPDRLLEPVPLPPEIGIWGVDSGIRHAVSGADYGTVRTAAFMGYRMIADLAGLPVAVLAPGRVRIDDPEWHGYLANIGPAIFHERFACSLPEVIDGASFLDRYQGITDPVTMVDPDRRYPVREATRHPVDEHARVARFAEILRRSGGEGEWGELGALMYESHASYSACGLGAEGTDRLVELVRALGPAEGLYGAKITGGGSGGTVAILGRADAGGAVTRVAAAYARQTGRPPLVISGTSPGAALAGARRFPRG